MIPLRDRLPTRRMPIVTYLILAANILVFLWERALLSTGYPVRELLMEWGLVPARFFESPAEQGISVLSSMFMHDPSGWFHIGSNMLFLWIFGDNVEDAMGRVQYAAFYVLSGVAAAGAQILVDPGSHIPMVGASGAIAGVLAAYGSLYPRSPITVLNPIVPLWLFFGLFIELPAWIIIAEFFVVNLFNGVTALDSRGGVAFFAHIGGFMAGLILVRFFVQPRRPRGEDDRGDGWRRPPRSRGQNYSPAQARRPWPWE